MFIEKEYKFEITEEKRKELSDEDGVFISNVMYDNGSLEKENSRLRLRKTPEKTLLTYKKPVKSEGNAKREIEYEVEVIGDIVPILNKMGFFPTTSYEKYQVSFNKYGSKITIDKYPFTTIVEIEGGDMDRTAESMGLDPKDSTDKAIDTIHTERFGFLKHIKFN